MEYLKEIKSIFWDNCKRDWKYWTLVLAGVYNLAWGAYVMIFPRHFFVKTGLELNPNP